jgi:phage gpG-like protein
MYTAESFGNGGDAMRATMQRLLNTRDLARKGGELLMDSQKKNIEESRMPDGEEFPPLKLERPNRRGAPIADGWGGDVVRYSVREHPYAHKPLLDTTNMYQSIHYEVLDDHEAFAGPSLAQAPYFPHQNQGAPRRGIPARTFIGIRSEDVTSLEDFSLHHAMDAMNV